MKRRLHLGHMLLLALALLAVILIWRALAVALAPMPALPAFSAPFLADKNLLGQFDPFFPDNPKSGDTLPVTALPLSLHGLRADSATGQGSAFIATAEGEQKLFAVGDLVSEGVTLKAIADDHVILDNNGTPEALWLDNSGTQSVQRYDPDSSYQPLADPDESQAIAPSDVPDEAPGPQNQNRPPPPLNPIQQGAAVEAAAPPLALGGEEE